MYLHSVVAFLVVILSPLISYAQVAISEVMYDPAGTDTKREWVEVCNVSSGSVDLTTFKLFESSSNHGIVAFSGGSTLEAGRCGVVADDPASFKIDFPSYSDALFDSSFSLSNSGEQLILRTAADVDIDTSSYPATAAKGDGNTLHRSGSTYTAGAATPGTESGFSAPSGSGSSGTGDVDGSQVNQNGNTATPAAGVGSVINFQTVTVEPTPKLTVRATVPAESVVGVLTKMDAEAYNTKGQVVKANFKWNFGDGMSDTGADVRHAYGADGAYAVHVSASIDGLSDSVTHSLFVAPSLVKVSASADGKTMLVQNSGDVSLDLTAWKIKAGGQYYVFPDNTFILPKTTVKFSQTITKITEAIFARYIELLNPAGDRIADAHVQAMHDVTAVAPAVTREPLSVAAITLAGLQHKDVPVVQSAPSQTTVAAQSSAKVVQRDNQIKVAEVIHATTEKVAVKTEMDMQQQEVSQGNADTVQYAASTGSSGFNMNLWYVAIGILCLAVAVPLYLVTSAGTPTPNEIPAVDEITIARRGANDFEIVDVTSPDQKPF